MDNIDRIPKIVARLYKGVRELEELFPGRRFTLDGHLVGSIGEVLAAHAYGLELLVAGAKGHDAVSVCGTLVQIKATQRSSVGIRSEPEHLIVLKLTETGQAEEVFNGPGRLAWENAGPMQKNGQRLISVSKLAKIQEKVPTEQMLPATR